MKLKIPATTVEACDICGQAKGGGLLTRCVVCRKEYCYTCEAIMCGCIHQPEICKPCGENAKVRAVVDRFTKPLMDILRKRDAAMRRHKP